MGLQDRLAAAIAFSVLVVLWLGFLIHRSPFFAGSLLGGASGVLGATLMLASLSYTVVKRSPALRRVVASRSGIAPLLRAHITFGLLGSLFAVIHSGHRFNSVLGMVVTASMLLSVLTGFIGQYYLRYVTESVREKKAQLDSLWLTLDGRSSAKLEAPAVPGITLADAGLMSLASVAADLQYSVEFQEPVRRLFKAWLAAHIAFSVIFYLALGLHIWAGIYFGLRWFR